MQRMDGLSRRRALGAAGAGLMLPQAALAQPRRGGRIRVATMASSTSDTLDPAKGALSTDYVRHNMLYSGLTQFDGRLTPQPALAESIETRDHITWRLRLRKGVEFHDGKPLTSADVVYSLLRHKDPATASKAKAVADQFADARADGPNEVVLKLTGANVDLPSILAISHFLIVKDGVRDFRTAVGTGPYRLKLFRPGMRTIVSRNPNYWKAGRPYLDEIELIGVPDEVSRVNAVLSGDVHLTHAVNPRSVKRIQASGAHAVLETRAGMYTYLVPRLDRTPTGHPDFVLAMKHLLDRDLIRRALFRGYATLANDHPVPPGHRYHLAGLPQRSYDPDRARFLLNRSGLLNVRMPVYASPAAEGSVDMASILQEASAKIGLRLAVNRVPADGYSSTHWMKHPLMFGNVNPRPTADLMFSLFFKSDSPWNASRWRNARFDQLLIAARSETDEARRRQLYGDMQELVHDGAGAATPVFISNIDAFDRRLKGMATIPIGGLMGYSFAEYVWLEA